MSNILISIIIPVYKVEKYLSRCLDSIRNQTFTNWECLLIDDGSPDNSGKICDEYAEQDHRFRVFHQKNAGVSAARNKGLDEAKGEWIGFVDSDDWIDNEMYNFMYNNAIKHNADVVCCGIELFTNGKKEKVPFKDKSDIFYKFQHYRIYMHSPCNKLIKRSIIGDKRLDTKMKAYEDLVLIFDIFTDNNIKIKFFEEPSLYVYFQENENSSKHLVLGSNWLNSTLQLRNQIFNMYIQKKINGKEANKYHNFIDFSTASPYINMTEFFNPQKFREVYGRWNFKGCTFKSFLQVLFTHCKMDKMVNLLLQIKTILKQ